MLRCQQGMQFLRTQPQPGQLEAIAFIGHVAEARLAVAAAVTAATGIDAMAHCVEAFTNRKAHPLIDNYARMGFSLVARYLPRAVADGTDAEARAARARGSG